ncbi:hypothetical protein [Kitasatospora sp. NPDC101183]|uniref:hypothetical protein n=1 Tax=Kitasatospora sp. NPDC101183 TaxID=3364100 RepID=UPI00382D324E
MEETILHGLELEMERPPDTGAGAGAGADQEAPIYAELARRWQAEGRAVPGLPDPVWESLAGG